MQFLKSGASGTAVFSAPAAPPADEIAATFSQWLNVSVEIALSPTLATASLGTESLLPQAARATARDAKRRAPSARTIVESLISAFDDSESGSRSGRY